MKCGLKIITNSFLLDQLASHYPSGIYDIAVPIQMRYNIISRGVGARQCRAPTGVTHVNEKRYINIFIYT